MTSFHLVVALMSLLLVTGLIMVLSSSSVVSYTSCLANLGPADGPQVCDNSSFSVFQRQLIFAVVGGAGFMVAVRLPVRVIRAWSTAFVMVSLVLLAAVLVVGKMTNGARSWISLGGGFSLQPSEFAKLALLLWAAHVFAAKRSSLGSLKQLLVPVIPVAGLIALLVMLQPDLGTLIVLSIVLGAVMWFAGAPLWLYSLAAVLAVGGMLYLATSAEYRMARLLAFVNPAKDPDASFQLFQGLYGMGRGGIFGVGLGNSVQKWRWLPFADSDFIFAIIGEELGLIGAGLVIAMFAALAYTGLRIARRNVDPFAKIAAGSITVWLVGQAAINIGYVVGVLPTTGLTLPLISSGGSSLVVTMTAFGVLANLARREPAAAAALHAGGPGPIARFLGIHPAEPGSGSTPKRTARKAAARAERRAAAKQRKEIAARERADATARANAERARAARAGAGQPAGAGRDGADRSRPDRRDRGRGGRDRERRDRVARAGSGQGGSGQGGGGQRRDGHSSRGHSSRDHSGVRRDGGARRGAGTVGTDTGQRVVAGSRPDSRRPRRDEPTLRQPRAGSAGPPAGSTGPTTDPRSRRPNPPSDPRRRSA